MITSAVFIRYETDKNFDDFWQWLIYGQYLFMIQVSFYFVSSGAVIKVS